MNTAWGLSAARRRTPALTRPPRGVVLVIVLLVVALLALSAYTFADLMLAHHAATKTHGDLAQAQALMASAVAATRTFLLQEKTTQQQLGGVYDNPNQFQSQIVLPGESPEFEGRFSVVATTFDTTGYPVGIRYGLQNESARLNVNALLEMFDSPDAEQPGGEESGGGPGGDGGNADGNSDEEPSELDDEAVSESNPPRDALMSLPGMTLEVADAILDWIDDDDETREFGAEVDYYSSLDPPYAPKNGPLQSLTELLMVRGVTPELLFGRDSNRNGMLEASETTQPISAEIDPSLGSLDLGWNVYLTIFSQERITDPNGDPKIDLNSEDLETLYTDLTAVMDEESAKFVILYRQNGPAKEDDDQDGDGGSGDGGSGDGRGGGSDGDGNGDGNGDSDGEVGEPIGGRAVDPTQPGSTNIEHLLDLVGVNVRAQFEEEEEPALIASPFADNPQSLAASLPTLLDYATVDGSQEIVVGRININQALRGVLLAIPGMTEEVADTCVAQQIPDSQQPDSSRRHPTWLLTEGFVDLETMREIMPYLTAGGDVFRAHIVGHFGDGNIVSRADIVLDATGVDVPVLLWKDMSSLGRGFTREFLTSGTMTPSQP